MSYLLVDMIADIPNLVSWHPTGSRFICDPPPMDTDEDTMILVEEGALEYAVNDLKNQSWEMGGSEVPGNPSRWISFRKDFYNFIVTDSKTFYDQMVAATMEAKRLNLLKKEDRVALFRTFCV